MTTTQPAALPELPEPDIHHHMMPVWRDDVECEVDLGPRYTADQMRAYALATLQPQPAAVSGAEIDAHLDVILRASGSALRHYTMAKTKADMRAALRSAILSLRPQSYPLPDDLYDSKDWRQGNYASRVEWLHTMYENAKRELDEYAAQIEALRPAAHQATKEPR